LVSNRTFFFADTPSSYSHRHQHPRPRFLPSSAVPVAATRPTPGAWIKVLHDNDSRELFLVRIRILALASLGIRVVF
jgi:hypothetical protein